MSMPPPSFRGPEFTDPNDDVPPANPFSEPPPSLLRYRVVLHRVAGQGLLCVAAALRELTRFGEAEAMSRMWQAHHSGRSLVLETHLERAELYVEQFTAKGLATSIEPA